MAEEGTTPRDRRFPAALYRHGSDPDPRFSLANERTFLAWIRTSLALLAVGVALEAFAFPIQPGLRVTASVLLIAAGIAAPIQAWLGWIRTERAMRLGEPLPSPRLGVVVSIVVVVSAGLLFVGAFLWR